jgi:predicted RNase H-like HicB family nuclease
VGGLKAPVLGRELQMRRKTATFACMTIRVVVHKAEESGFWAEVPPLPGCMTQGETMEELKSNLREAIELWFEGATPADLTGEEDQVLELAL